MQRPGRLPTRLVLGLLVGVLAGCGLPSPRLPSEPAPPPRPAQLADTAPQVERVAYRLTLQVPTDADVQTPQTSPRAAVFPDSTELSAEALIREVVARNPSLAQMTAAWQAAQARYPQVTALDDPMLMAKMAPGSIGSNTVDFGYMIEVSQKLPFCGKLALRGDNALAEAHAAGHDVEDVRLQLIESAHSAFADYYLAARALAVNEKNLELLTRLRKNAVSRYESGTSKTNQEFLQADVEVGRENDRRLTLKQMQQVAVARINSLLHLPPDSPLPPPPRQVDRVEALPEAQVLRAAALARRPDLQALADRIKAEQATLGLAEKEFYPDFEVAAGYDSFWQEKPLRPEVNVRLNVPVSLAKRQGAVSEAEARLAQRKAELARQVDQVNFQVQEAYEQLRQSEQSVRLYEQTILKKARENREAAESAYGNGLIPFLSLIEAQRSEEDLLDRYYQAVADAYRRQAALERAIGGPLPPGTSTGHPKANAPSADSK
jgi:cobalt-zinc-cadmium efflux system outer membrane protein